MFEDINIFEEQRIYSMVAYNLLNWVLECDDRKRASKLLKIAEKLEIKCRKAYMDYRYGDIDVDYQFNPLNYFKGEGYRDKWKGKIVR